MSALGQTQTYAVQQPMSALPPIATLIAQFGLSALPLKADIVDRLEKSASCHEQTFTVIQSTSLGKR